MKYLALTFFAVVFSFTAFATIGPITGPSTMCAGTCVQLSNATPGGTWSTSSSAAATISPTGLLCASLSSSLTVTYATASGSAFFGISIFAQPGAITGATGVCVGGSYTLSDATSGGTWSSSNPSIASVNPSTGFISGMSAGSGNISYIIPPGCYSTKSFTIISLACSTLTGATTICKTGCSSDTLTVPNNCGMSYQWQSSPDNFTWSNVTGAIVSTYMFNPSASLYYRCAITCISSGTTIYSTSSFINVGSPSLHSAITNPLDTVCMGLSVHVTACGAPGAYNVTTYYGDGTSGNVALTTSGVPYADINHVYEAAGTYSIRQVLYNGTTPVDSITFSYDYLYCRMLPLKFYIDNNTNCIFDADEIYNFLPLNIEIDSNGVVIDTISTTSGFYYKATGPAGTIYGFKLLPCAGLTAACPASGIFFDTLQAYVNNYAVKYFGLTGASSGGFDLSAKATILCGRHAFNGTVNVQNLLPALQPAILTVNHDPRYGFSYASVPPASITSTSITWNIAGLSSISPQPIITFHLEAPVWLIAGDTVTTTFLVSPTTGDADTTNNFIIRVDTAKSSYDPNYIESNPAGYVLPGAQLQYTIHFENTGNDTAQNISVMDTLSDNLIPGTFEIVTSSAVMNTTLLNDGIHNIVKFDFPNIKLLDSSHHKLCDGFVMYNIRQRNNLTDGTTIFNHAGIFFDDNAVVMTDTVENIIAYIHGAANACISANDTLIELAKGGVWNSSNAHATVSGGIVNGVSTGTDTIRYTITYANGPITVTKIITINPSPVAGSITGLSVVCEASSITLSDAVAGGGWSASGGAWVSGGLVTGIATGTAVITYAVTNTCGTAITTHTVTVNPLPNSGTITGPSTVCESASITLTDGSPGGVWAINNGNATLSGNTVTGVVAGTDTVSYTVSNSCGSTTTVYIITVNTCPNEVSTVNQQNNLYIYPNPTTGELTIATDKGAYNSFTITNEIGQVVMQQQLSSETTNVNIKTLSTGLYYITLKGDSGIRVMKIVKM